MVVVFDIFCHGKTFNLDRIKKFQKTYVTLELFRSHVFRYRNGDYVIDHLWQVFDVLPLFERTTSKGLSSLLGDFANDLFTPPRRLSRLDITRLFEFVKTRIDVASGRLKAPLTTFFDELCQFVTAHRAFSKKKVQDEERIHCKLLLLM